MPVTSSMAYKLVIPYHALYNVVRVVENNVEVRPVDRHYSITTFVALKRVYRCLEELPNGTMVIVDCPLSSDSDSDSSMTLKHAEIIAVPVFPLCIYGLPHLQSKHWAKISKSGLLHKVCHAPAPWQMCQATVCKDHHTSRHSTKDPTSLLSSTGWNL